MTTPQATETTISPQMQQLRQILASDTSGSGWDTAWKNGITPWDKGDIQPTLRSLIESKKVQFPTSGKALVPGCGRGYDAVYIGSYLGLETFGMDISATAIEAANLNLSNTKVPEGARITFTHSNFFDQVSTEADKFDLCYDYTFFVAIPPSLRPSWGSQMRALVKSGGYLITLVFPIDGDRTDGPPFSVNTDIYTKHLQGEPSGGFWSKVLEEETSNAERRGREKIVVWRRN